MKKSLIGIGVLIGGIIESHGVIIAVASNLVDNWTTPPGRLVTTLIETGCIFVSVFNWMGTKYFVARRQRNQDKGTVDKGEARGRLVCAERHFAAFLPV